MSARLFVRLSPVLFAALVAGCGNPAVDAKIDALGGEVEGVKPGPYHRPGQPCVLCHGAYHGTSPLFTVAGTVFAQDASTKNEIPINGVVVHLTDSFGSTKDATTNCAGNFFLKREDWDPGFPLAVKVDCPTPDGKARTEQGMSGRIGRDGSCGGCHLPGRGKSSPGLVACLAPTQTNDPKTGYKKPTHDDCPEGVP